MLIKSNFTIKSIILSTMLWLVDSTIHKLFYGEEEFEFIPTEINELWMRSIIVILLIIFGIYADKHTSNLLKKEAEKNIIFQATIQSSQHILNNLLNQMSYLKIIADEKNAFTDNNTELFNNSIKEGKELVEKLSSVKNLTEENIRNSVLPK